MPDAPVNDAPELCTGYAPIMNGQPGSRYRLLIATTWLPAEIQCEVHGAHLVVLGDSNERDAILEMVAPSAADLWIGMSDRRTNGSFLDVTGDSSQYFEWDSGEPVSGSDCVLLIVGGGSHGKFRTQNCSTVNVAVCECDGQSGDPTSY